MARTRCETYGQTDRQGDGCTRWTGVRLNALRYSSNRRGCNKYGSYRLFSHVCLTHCILVDSSTVICWTSIFIILGVLGLFCHFHSIFRWKILLAENVDPDQMTHYVASDLGLRCSPMTLLHVSR